MRNSSVKWSHMGNFDPNPTNTISLPTLWVIWATSSVKWGHLGNFDLETNFPTNPMGSSGPLVV